MHLCIFPRFTVSYMARLLLSFVAMSQTEQRVTRDNEHPMIIGLYWWCIHILKCYMNVIICELK